jgi:hypothetical protein
LFFREPFYFGNLVFRESSFSEHGSFGNLVISKTWFFREPGASPLISFKLIMRAYAKQRKICILQRNFTAL